jgi:hypothetical protein
MKNTIGVLLICASGILAKAQVKRDTAFVHASYQFETKEQRIVAINWSAIVTKHPRLTPGNFRVLEKKSGAEIPYQLLYLGTDTPKSLLVKLTFEGPGADIMIIPGKPAEFPLKTYGRYVPERKDDFAWENDKIAFRMYGKALEGSSDNAFGMDVWAKRTDQLVIDKWYKSGDYHVDHGDGLDYYHVGFTLGAGDIAPYVNNTIVFPKNYRRWKILDKGPLRFSFQLEYDGWDVAGKTVSMIKKISLDAGSQLNRVETTFDYGNDTASLPVVIGIVRRKEPGVIHLNEKQGSMSYSEPEHGKDGIMNLGTILASGKLKPERMLLTDSHLLTMIKVKSRQPVVYYTGAVWSKAGSGIGDWDQHLGWQAFGDLLATTISVTVK